MEFVKLLLLANSNWKAGADQNKIKANAKTTDFKKREKNMKQNK